MSPSSPSISAIPRMFVSHSHHDNAFCRPFVAHLRAALGLSDPDHIFYDETSFHAGDAWLERIQREVLARPIFLVILTPRSVPADYVRFETTLALRETITHHDRLLISLLAEECDPDILAPALRSYQMADFLHKRYDTAFEELVASLRGTAAPAAPVTTSPQSMPTPQPAPDPRAAQTRRLIEDAQAALAAGHVTDAALKAELALTLPGGDTPEVRALLARAYAGAGQWAKARDAATRALDDDPFAIPLWRLLAEAHHRLNAPADALAALDRAQALTPLSDTATRLAILSERRGVLTAQEQWPAALATIEDEVRLAPDDHARLEALADLQAKTNHPQDARDTLRRLTARPNARAAAWIARARFALAAKDAHEAQTALDAAARLMPNAATDSALTSLRAQLDDLPRPIPRERFPQRLSDLGFTARNERDVEYILPPLCPVPAGPFLMGSDPKRDPIAQSAEQPQHTLTLPAYQIARYPVTVAEYACFVRAGYAAPSAWQTRLSKLDHPVTYITWHDAIAYATWLAQLTSQPWRLPTEAEWEKAARGADGRLYPWGDTFDSSRANTSESGKLTTTPVGTYPSGASPCGAQDMAGNVWEWTSSLFMSYPYNPNDGREDLKSTVNRVLRGGSWLYGSTGARAAYRDRDLPDLRGVIFGFRVALAAPGSAH